MQTPSVRRRALPPPDMHKVDLPIIYQSYGVPPRARKAQHFFVAGKVSVEFHDSPSYEALRYVHVDPRLYGGRHVTSLPVTRGMLARPAWSARLHRINEAALASLRPSDVPEALRPGNTRGAYAHSSGRIYDEGEINPARVVYDGREQAEAEVRAAADSRFAIIEGVLHVRASDPCWRIHPFGPGAKVEASLGDHGRLWFPADCVKEKDEFARWSAARGYPLETTPHHFEILAIDIPYETNPLVEMAVAIARISQANIGDHAPFGEEVRAAATALLSRRTVTDAIDFMQELDGPARSEAAPAVLSYASDMNRELLDAFWKVHELLPVGYKCSPEDEITLPPGP